MNETPSEAESNTSSTGAGNQQRLDSVGEDAEESVQGGDVDRGKSVQQGHVDICGETTPPENESEIREQLEAAISALQRINAEL